MTLADQIKEARREVALRRRVFPGWVASGRLSQADADHRIEAMDAIVASLLDLQARRAPTLFDGDGVASGR